jgi:hypothetical protein
VTGDEFAASVEELITDARKGGVPDEALIVILQDAVAVLADGLT